MKNESPPRHAKQHKQQFQFYSKLISNNWLKKIENGGKAETEKSCLILLRVTSGT